MSLDLTQLVFPNNAVELIAARFEMIDPDILSVFRRELRLADPNYSIGVSAVDWAPVPNSMEMLGEQGTHSSTLEQYLISIQALVKMDDEAAGLIAHSIISKTLRAILAKDAPLRAQLGGLTATYQGETERLKRWWVRQSRYHSNKLHGTSTTYVTVNDVIIEVEKV